MRCLSGGPQAGMMVSNPCNTRNECPIISYAAACPTQVFGDAAALDRGSL